ncbi:helix-turn-helix domain-containing protein [Flavobacterium sp.]|uniref:helix-turn-helix domain-containing protein n=1 Tax=Flavobacterium sp. TaxID=239 RepID=UPI0039E34F19
MKSFFPAFLFLCSTLLIAQNTVKKGTDLSYYEIQNQYFDNEKDTLKTTQFARLYIEKAQKEKSNINIARGYYLLAIKYYATDYPKAIDYLDQVIHYSNGTGDLYFPVAAYCEKADLLSKLFKNTEALENFLTAEKYAQDHKNTDSYYEVRYKIGVFKSEKIGEVQEAVGLYKECFEHIKSKDLKDPYYASQYNNIVFALADGYSALEKYDLASQYNAIGYRASVKSKDEKMQYLFMLNEGAVQASKENYTAALDSIHKAQPKLKTMTNIGLNLLASYHYLGKIYEKTHQDELAEKNYLVVDSLYNIDKNITPEFVGGYRFLIDYYKQKKDKDKQLKYLSTFIEIDGNFRKSYVQWNQLLKYKYDIPHLIQEKESIISRLKTDKAKSRWFFALMAVTIVLILAYTFRLKRQQKNERIKFEELIAGLSREENQSGISTEPLVKKNEEDIGISKEIVDKIIEKFKAFEQDKLYLKNDVSLITLSQSFETNSKYISKVINYYSKKSLTNYLNDLRIDYIVQELQHNKSLRKYTINAISEEIGFNNAESFSKAFYKKTGIKPSFFIKELEKKKKQTVDLQ